jgi:hypothetical protein
MAVNILLRRGTAAEWTASNPTLLEGEVGVETDSKKLKVGDGLTVWASLPYITLTPAAAASLYATIANPTFTGTVSLDTGVSLVFEGATANAFETTVQAADPTADRTLTLPDSTGTIATQEYANSAIGTHTAVTTSVHGIADTAALATKVYADAAVTTHEADTTSVHGISDTSVLTTASNTQTLSNKTLTSPKINEDVVLTTTATELNYVDGVTSAIQTQINDKAPIASPTFTGTVAGITKTMVGLGNVDNTADASKPVSTAQQTALDLKSNIAGPTFTGTVTVPTLDVTTTATGITKTMVGLANVDNTADASKPVSTAQQTALDLKANLANPTFTGTVSGVTKTHVGLGNADNTSDANKPVSTAQQTALDLKANLNAPTFTGTVSGITKTMVGLGNVDNTADSAKPVSTATQTALDAKLALAGGTMTGAITLSGAPTSDLHAATKLYVDNVTAGINFHESVHAASVTNLAVIYNNGTAGVGATLTADTNRAFSTLDGESVVLGQRVLIKNQTDAKQNGIYTLTTVGSVSVPWVLTRATDADNNPSGEMKTGDFVFVQNGTVNASVGYINNSTANPIVIGTDNISYTEFNAGKTIVAGAGLEEAVPGTLSVATGGVTSTMILDGTIVDGDINASAAIAKTKISGTAITAADTGTVTSAMIADGTIVDGDINASAAIAQSKISGLSTSLGLKADLASPTFTGTVTIPAGASISGFAPLASPTFTGTNNVAALTASGLITASASGVAFTDGTQTLEGVPSRTPIIQKTASYTLSALTERDDLIEVANASATTITIPLNSAVAFPIGTSIDILQTSTGQVTIAGAAGVTVNATPGLKLRTQWSSCTLFKRAENTWVVFGDLTA